MERTEVNEMEELKHMPPGPGKDARMLRLAERIEKSGEWAKYISPPGALESQGVTGLLEENRLRYGIPDACFRIEAVFDRIFVFQLPRVFGDLIEGTTLIKPESVRQREEEGTPRGVIVSAGLQALDNLISNGIGLGHVVNFIRLSPWKITLLEIAGVEVNLLVLRDGDIIASEELPMLREKGDVHTIRSMTDGGIEHRLQFTGAKMEPLKPRSPWIPEDM